MNSIAFNGIKKGSGKERIRDNSENFQLFEEVLNWVFFAHFFCPTFLSECFVVVVDDDYTLVLFVSSECVVSYFFSRMFAIVALNSLLNHRLFHHLMSSHTNSNFFLSFPSHPSTLCLLSCSSFSIWKLFWLCKCVFSYSSLPLCFSLFSCFLKKKS